MQGRAAGAERLRSLALATRHFARRSLRRIGLDAHRFDPTASSGDLLVTLIGAMDIECVIDVGANEGQFAAGLRAAGFRGRIISFEPGSEAFGILERNAAVDPSWTAVQLALGRQATKLEINILDGPTTVASLHRPLPTQAERLDFMGLTRGTETVCVERLDAVLPDLLDQMLPRLLLKVDTQGHDLEVLRGSEGILGHVAVIQTEVSFAALYEDQPTWQESIEHLAGIGFVPTAFFPVVRDDDWSLIESDCVLVRQRGL
jgi:FkbM family methyltransferase